MFNLKQVLSFVSLAATLLASPAVALAEKPSQPDINIDRIETSYDVPYYSYNPTFMDPAAAREYAAEKRKNSPSYGSSRSQSYSSSRYSYSHTCTTTGYSSGNSYTVRTYCY